MVSIVPSIIPILTANAVAANQVKRKNKSLNNNEKKLKDSPLNNKINCRVFLNNGKIIEGHYEGNWYEDNSDEEGIWIKTDNGIEEINSKDYDRVEYYHKKTVKESSFDNEINNILKNAGVKLNEEMIHAEKSFYDGDDFAYILKNPTKNELKGYGLTRTRFICFNNGTWLFFDPMQWIHAHIWNKYKDKFGGSTNMGFYDLYNNEFIFIESMDYDEDEEGYEEEFNYYESKSRKWLLEQPYIVNTFGTDFNIMVYGDWVDSPW